MISVHSNNLTELFIESSGFCNAKCPHCPRYTDDGFLHNYIPETHLTIEAFRNGLDPATLINLKTVQFSGATGDPAMNPHIEDLIDFFKFVPSITMDTNGSLRDSKWWNKLARFTNLTVVWSIDGLADTNHLYRVATNFNKIIKNAQSFINGSGRAIWKCVVFKHNEHQLEEIKKLAQDLGFVGVKFMRAFDYRFQGHANFPVMVEGKYLHTIEPGSLSDKELLRLSSLPVQHEKTQDIPLDVLCPWLKNRTAYINVLGELLPCCMMTHETTNDYPGTHAFRQFLGGDFKNISLYHHNIDHILKNYYSDSLNESLKSADTMQYVCAKTCQHIIASGQGSFKGVRIATRKNNDV